MSSAAKYRCELEELGLSHAANIICQVEAYDDLMKHYSKTQERLKFRHAAELEQHISGAKAIPIFFLCCNHLEKKINQSN